MLAKRYFGIILVILTFMGTLNATTKEFIRALKDEVLKQMSVMCSVEKIGEDALERKVDAAGSERNKLGNLLGRTKICYPIYVVSRKSIPSDSGGALTRGHVQSFFVSKAGVTFQTLNEPSKRLVIFFKKSGDDEYNKVIDDVVGSLKYKVTGVECVFESEVEALVTRRTRDIRAFEDAKNAASVHVASLSMEKIASTHERSGGGGKAKAASGGAAPKVALYVPVAPGKGSCETKLRLRALAEGACAVTAPEIVKQHFRALILWLKQNSIPYDIAWYNGTAPVFGLGCEDGSKRAVKVWYVPYSLILLDKTFTDLVIPAGRKTHPEYHLVLYYDIPEHSFNSTFKDALTAVSEKYHVSTIPLTSKDVKLHEACASITKHCKTGSPAKLSPANGASDVPAPSLPVASFCHFDFGGGSAVPVVSPVKSPAGEVGGMAACAPPFVALDKEVGKEFFEKNDDDGCGTQPPTKFVRRNLLSPVAVVSALGCRADGVPSLLGLPSIVYADEVLVKNALDAVISTCTALELEAFLPDSSMNFSALPVGKKVVFLKFSRCFMAEDGGLLFAACVANRFLAAGTNDLLPQFDSENCLIVVLNDLKGKFNLAQILLLNAFKTRLNRANIFWMLESFSDEGIKDPFVGAICKFAGISE